jgi:hypothetical protein
MSHRVSDLPASCEHQWTTIYSMRTLLHGVGCLNIRGYSPNVWNFFSRRFLPLANTWPRSSKTQEASWWWSGVSAASQDGVPTRGSRFPNKDDLQSGVRDSVRTIPNGWVLHPSESHQKDGDNALTSAGSKSTELKCDMWVSPLSLYSRRFTIISEWPLYVWVQQKTGNFLTTWETISFSRSPWSAHRKGSGPRPLEEDRFDNGVDLPETSAENRRLRQPPHRCIQTAMLKASEGYHSCSCLLNFCKTVSLGLRLLCSYYRACSFILNLF